MNHVFSLDGTALSSSLPQKDALKDNAFNAVRFVCCLIVIVGHSLGLSGTPFAYSGLIDMHISVCVFFILSGFWVTKSFLSVRSLKEYFLKRAKRLLPLYYITVVGFAVVCVLYSDLDTAAYFTDGGFWRYLFWNALFLNFILYRTSAVDVYNTQAELPEKSELVFERDLCLFRALVFSVGKILCRVGNTAAAVVPASRLSVFFCDGHGIPVQLGYAGTPSESAGSAGACAFCPALSYRNGTAFTAVAFGCRHVGGYAPEIPAQGRRPG